MKKKCFAKKLEFDARRLSSKENHSFSCHNCSTFFYAENILRLGEGGEPPQNIASNPVQLTVGFNSTLLLTVSKEENSNTHTFTVRLVKDDRNGLYNRLVTLRLNDTEHEYNATTNQNGYATWTLSLSPQTNNSATVYNIVASFEGDTAKVANAYMTTPNGTQVSICTTIQYSNYKPSANSTSLIIMPQTST